MRLPQKTALVTGGTRGLGWAIAERFALEGARVALCGRDADEASRAAAALPRPDGNQGPHLGLGADLTRPEDIDRLVTSVTEAFGKLDILVNNAGVTRDTLFIRMKEED